MSLVLEIKKVEDRHTLLESLDKNNRNTYLVWEGVGYQLKEAALSPQQIQGLFAEIEKSATAAGDNRTGIGQAKDKVDQVILKPWNDLKAKIYNSGPMEGFAAKYDEAAEKLKQSAGGDEGAVMQIVKKYRQFAEKHPIMQGFLYAALIAAAGVSGAGLGGAAALGLFKLTDQLLQGKDVRSALYSAGKTGALAYGASTLGDMIKGGDGLQADLVSDGPPMDANFIDARIDNIMQDFDGRLSTEDMNFITDLPTQEGVPQEILDAYNNNLLNFYDVDGLNLADWTPGTELTPDQMNAMIDLDNMDAIPSDVTDQFNSQLQSHMDSGGVDVNTGIDGPAGDTSQVELGPNARTNANIELQRQYPGGQDPEFATQQTSMDLDAEPRTDSPIQTNREKLAQRVQQQLQGDEVADLRAKADAVGLDQQSVLDQGGSANVTAVRGDIPLSTSQAQEFGNLFPGQDAMSKEATQWLRDNVPGAAENLDAKIAATPVPTDAQLKARKAAGIFNSGHSNNPNVLSEQQVGKLFVAIAYKQNLMEAPGGMLSNLKQQIGKGVSKLGQKAKQVGTNITTKVTADKLMKAWTKAGKPTDSVQVAQFLQNFGIQGAVMAQGFETAGIKMPDLKKIASDDPIMALVQKINANPTIKKQVLQYLEAVT